MFSLFKLYCIVWVFLFITTPWEREGTRPNQRTLWKLFFCLVLSLQKCWSNQVQVQVQSAINRAWKGFLTGLKTRNSVETRKNKTCKKTKSVVNVFVAHFVDFWCKSSKQKAYFCIALQKAQTARFASCFLNKKLINPLTVLGNLFFIYFSCPLV